MLGRRRGKGRSEEEVVSNPAAHKDVLPDFLIPLLGLGVDVAPFQHNRVRRDGLSVGRYAFHVGSDRRQRLYEG